MWRHTGTLVVIFCPFDDYLFDYLAEFGIMWRRVETLVDYLPLFETLFFDFLALLVFFVKFRMIMEATG